MNYDVDTGRPLKKWALPNPPEWLRAYCSGSTTDARTLTIVAEGEHLAILKHPGGGNSYKIRYEVVQKHAAQHHMRRVREIPDLDGRQKTAAINNMIMAMQDLDKRWPEREATRKREQEKRDAVERAKRAKADAEQLRDEKWLKARAKVIGALKDALAALEGCHFTTDEHLAASRKIEAVLSAAGVAP